MKEWYNGKERNGHVEAREKVRNEIALVKKHSLYDNLAITRYDYYLRFLLKGILSGIVAGMVGVAFRLVLTEGDMWRNGLLTWARSVPVWGWLVLPGLGAVAGAFAGWLTGLAPEAAGSGIPHVEAVLIGRRELVWWRVIPVKFIAGALAIGAGLSLGREGPTVQMGAAAGQLISKYCSRSKTEALNLIACGAGAGLAAAFNAPLAGVIFVLEELRRNFSPYVLGGAFAASITADLISQKILGPLPTFRLKELLPVPLNTLPLFVILGILTGIFGVLFNRTLKGSLAAADRLKLPRWLKAAVLAFMAGLVGYFLPQVLGGGHQLAEEVLWGRVPVNIIPLLFVVKFLLTMFSYSVGVPGGIFLPLLVLGALLGSLVGQVGGLFVPWYQGLGPAFAVVGMAAYFVAIVRSPLTGIVLIIEMTGSYQHILPLLLTCMISYLVAEALGCLPVYEMLLERDLAKEEGKSLATESKEMVAFEVAVESMARACGLRVKDLNLPDDCLVVAIRRGSRELIPRGNTKLIEGDHITVIAPEYKAAAINEALIKATRCRI
ncbi:H(+)/Cl(-) exchange transporter ClcA [Neomoorella humiferrea]|uniref:H(+)/Cl(-) exchange transporter ClcA n=1 Tax=Neomoorella humiferrea TaxID=676965 RepID=UPI003D937B30